MKFIHSLFILLMIAASLKAQDFAKKQLEESPRHHEWVELESGGRTLHCFVVYPERPDKAKSVIVIHENRGLTDWVRSFSDQLAAKGYIAIAPDLLSNTVEGLERTSDFPNSDSARSAIYALDPGLVTRDLNAAFDYVGKLPAADGDVSVMGFCWGGSQTFRYSTNNPDLSAALVFYGTAPKDEDAYEDIEVPVYGFYGGNDARVNATIPETEELMEEFSNFYEHITYPGAGHAFMRRGDDPEGSQENKDARDEAWKRVIEILE